MKRNITLVAGGHLTATDRQYINAILDAGQTTGRRKGGLTVTLQCTDRQQEIDHYRLSTLYWRRAQDIEQHRLKGTLYAVLIKDAKGRTTRHIVNTD